MRNLYLWSAMITMILASTTGDVLQAHAMKVIGDVGALRRARGTFYVVGRVLTSGSFMLGLLFMALAFFSFLVALSWGDVSFVGPASASLTLIANAVAARIFLKEDVNRRRWIAFLLIAVGVVLLKH